MKRIAVSLLLIVLCGTGASAWLLRRTRQPYRGYPGVEQFVDIPPGAGGRSIGAALVEAGIVGDSVTFRVGLWLTGQARNLKAGEYHFDRPLTPLEVIDALARGAVSVVALTFPEGLTVAGMAQLFETRGLGRAPVFVEAARDGSPIQGLDPAASDLEGYLFPDTYRLSRRTDAGGLVRLMASRFEQVFTPELREATSARGLAVRQAVILASMVEKETGRPEERPIIAAVFLNRLRIGMALQCDSTVIYALERAGRYTGNLRREDLAFDSPYNTYRYAGLPPGPIASPGRASLEAVAHPAPVDSLYFVSRNDGSHAFARTLAEHNRNVQTYQRAGARANTRANIGR